MKKILFLFSLIILLTLTNSYRVVAQDLVWAKTFGGTDLDGGESVQQTSDNGYIIAGRTYSFGVGNADVYLIKTDINGDTMWTRTFGGSALDRAYSVQQTSDGGYIITGYTESYGAGILGNLLLIKISSNGDSLWLKTYGGSGADYGYSVRQTSDGGFIIVGRTFSFGAGSDDIWLIKTDDSGNTSWTKTFGGFGSETAFSVQQTSDNGYVIVGRTTTFSTGSGDIWLIKTDANGEIMWTKTFGGGSNDEGRSVQQTSDGGYIIAGYTASFGAGAGDIWLIKTNGNGDSLWTKTFGGSDYEYGYSVRQTSDGGYIFTGVTASFGAGSYDVWLVKTDDDGNTTGTRTFGGAGLDYGFSVEQTSQGGYVIAGETHSFGAGNGDVYLLQVDSPLGVVQLNLTLVIQGFYNANGNSMVQDTATVYLRNTSSPYNKIDSAKAILSSSGQGTFTFENASHGVNYYIQVNHRNSIETWSATGESFTNSPLIYDFSTSSDQAFGNNVIQVDASPVRFAIYNGDVNQDDVIDLTDIVSVFNDASNFVSGFVNTDLTGDMIIDLSDMTIAYNNSANFVHLIRP